MLGGGRKCQLLHAGLNTVQSGITVTGSIVYYNRFRAMFYMQAWKIVQI